MLIEVKLVEIIDLGFRMSRNFGRRMRCDWHLELTFCKHAIFLLLVVSKAEVPERGIPASNSWRFSGATLRSLRMMHHNDLATARVLPSGPNEPSTATSPAWKSSSCSVQRVVQNEPNVYDSFFFFF